MEDAANYDDFPDHAAEFFDRDRESERMARLSKSSPWHTNGRVAVDADDAVDPELEASDPDDDEFWRDEAPAAQDSLEFQRSPALSSEASPALSAPASLETNSRPGPQAKRESAANLSHPPTPAAPPALAACLRTLARAMGGEHADFALAKINPVTDQVTISPSTMREGAIGCFGPMPVGAAGPDFFAFLVEEFPDAQYFGLTFARQRQTILDTGVFNLRRVRKDYPDTPQGAIVDALPMDAVADYEEEFEEDYFTPQVPNTAQATRIDPALDQRLERLERAITQSLEAQASKPDRAAMFERIQEAIERRVLTEIENGIGAPAANAATGSLSSTLRKALAERDAINEALGGNDEEDDDFDDEEDSLLDQVQRLAPMIGLIKSIFPGQAAAAPSANVANGQELLNALAIDNAGGQAIA